jgi:Tol biopolymer transport system component
MEHQASRFTTLVMLAGLVVPLLTACDDPAGPQLATLEVRASTTGIDLDLDGYVIGLDGASLRTLPANGLRTFTDLAPGEHVIRIEGVDPNCTLADASQRSVTLVPGRTEVEVFEVTCVPSRGAIKVSVATTGEDIDVDGYGVVIEGQPPILVAGNGTVTIADVPSGYRPLRLDDVAENCAVSGPNPLTVIVEHGLTVDVSFAVSCLAPVNVTATVSTAGVDLDPDGYRVVLIRDRAIRGEATLAVQGSAVFGDLLPARYSLTLIDVAVNCAVAGANPRLVDATGGAVEATFEVTCSPLRELAFVNTADGNAEIYVVRSDGSAVRRLTHNVAADLDPSWSPDGSRLAFSSDRDGNREMYVMSADGSSPMRLTSNDRADYRPAWSPDGTKLAFVSERDGNTEIYVMNADGSGATRLTTDPGEDSDPAWSPDGARIAFTASRQGVGGSIWVMAADGSRPTRLTSDDGFYSFEDDRQPAWSPDGARIAFARADCGYYYYCGPHAIVVMNADGSSLTALEPDSTDLGDATDPSWYPEGGRIAYASVDCSLGEPCKSVIWVARLGTENIRILGDQTSSPAWRP